MAFSTENKFTKEYYVTQKIDQGTIHHCSVVWEKGLKATAVILFKKVYPGVQMNDIRDILADYSNTRQK